MKLFCLLLLSLLVLPTMSKAAQPTPTPWGYDDIGAYYYDLPDNYNMDSCEKIIADQYNDIISFDLPLWRCVGGKSSGNQYIPCNKDWVGAYAETAHILEFPLLKFLSAASAAGTEENPVQPMCYYDIQANITDERHGADTLDFSGEFPGPLELTGGSNPLTYKFPRAGTAYACGVTEWRRNNETLKLDIMSYEPLPQISDEVVESGWDKIFSFFLDLIKHFNIFELALESREDNNIVTVKEELAKIGIDRETVCDNLPRAINKINVSDEIKPLKGRERFVVNEEKEILNFTNTEVCDLQYIDGRVKGAICTFPDGTKFSGDKNKSMQSAFPGQVKWEPIIVNGIVVGMRCVEVGPICGATFGCNDPQSDAYKQCRATQGDVERTDGDPLLMTSIPGFKEMTIPGGNMSLANTVNVLEQLHSPWEIHYGENWGIKMDVQRKAYDLNTKDQEYNPLTAEAMEKDPDLIDSTLKKYISYELLAYNYIYKDEFKFDQIGNTAKTQYYFPFLGRLPYLMERISTIHSNSLNPITAYTLTNGYTNDPTADANNGRSNVLGAMDDNSAELIKPQLKYCKDLTEEEKLKEDCYGDRDDDPVEEYLCDYGLGMYCGQCVTEDPGGGGECGELGSMSGKVAWPFEPNAYGGHSGGGTHPGTDFGISTGTPIYAIANGEVVFVRDGLTYHCDPSGGNDCSGYNSGSYTTSDQYNYWWGGYANVIGIKHSDGVSVYAHLNPNTITVKVGDCVTQGQQIAESDNTGNSTGPHLHFEMRKLNCTDYLTSCTINNNAIDMFDSSLNTNPNSGGSDDGDVYCSDPYAIEGGVYVGGDLSCLFKVAAEALNAIDPRIAGEIIYAIARKETGLICSKTWEGWANGSDRTACTGDANQLAFITRNGVAWDGRIAQGLCPVDIRGFTQFSAKGNTQSCADTFNSVIKGNTEDMQACVTALGVSGNPSGEAVDPLSDLPQFSRHRVGDAICATAILIANYGKNFNGGNFVTPEEWLNLSGLGGQALEYAAGRYHGNCSLNYCTLAQRYAQEAIDQGIISSADCLRQ